MLKRISDVLVDKSKWFFVVIILILSGILPNLKPVPFNGKLEGFFMEHNPYMTNYHEFQKFFKHKYIVQLQLTPDDCQLGEFMEGLGQLGDSLLSNFPNAKLVSIYASKHLIYKTYDEGDPFISILPGIKDISILDQLISDDKKHVLVLLQLENEKDFDSTSFSTITASTYKAIAGIKAISRFHIENQINDSLRSDILRISLFILLLAIIIIVLIYKSVKVMLSTGVNILFSMIPLFLLFNIFDVGFNMISITAFPVVIILSLADSIHILTAFHHSEIVSRTASIKENIRKYIVPSFLTSITTAVAFFSFTLNDVKYIQEFGMVTGIAVLLEFIITFMTLPHLLKFLPSGKGRKNTGVNERIFAKLFHYKKQGSFLLISLLVLSGFFISKLYFHTDYDSFIPRNTPIKEIHKEIGNNFQSVFGIDMLIKTTERSPSSLKRITLELVDKLEKIDHIRLINSYNDVLELKKKYPLLRFSNQMAEVENIYLQENASRIHIALKDPSKILKIKEDIDKITNSYQNDYEFFTFSTALMFTYMNEHIAISLLKSLLFSGIFIFLIFLLVTRSFRNSLISILANLVPLGVLVLLFAIFRIEINIGTAITAVVCLGLIVDDTIQIIYRKLILKKPFKDLNFSLLITSAILAIGFCIFAISSFEPIQIFGVLCAAVFVVTFFSDILILNWLLKVDGNKKKQ